MPTPELPPTSPRRRALHERSPSQNNEASQSSIRLVHEPEEPTDIYSSNPFPTKPEHVLLPNPGNGQGLFINAGFPVSDDEPELPDLPTSSSATSRRHISHDKDQGFGDLTDLSSAINAEENSPSLLWEDPHSSRTTIPVPDSQTVSDKEDDEKTIASASDSDDGDIVVLPPATGTIRPVAPDSSPPQSFPPETSSEIYQEETSTPNYVSVAPTSSPNFIPLDDSSPNVVPLERTSPNYLTTDGSDSSLASYNTQGTVRRLIHHWSSGPRRESSSERDGTSAHSIPSSPPQRPARTSRSPSFVGNSERQSSGSRPRTASTNSWRSVSDVRAAIESASAATVQYPTIRAPSSSSRAETSIVTTRPFRSMSGHSSGRWNPHLSTVLSEWSAERLQSAHSPSLHDNQSGLSLTRPAAAKTRSAVWAVSEDDRDERSDSLSALRVQPLRSKSSILSSASSGSRHNSLRRASSASVFVNTIPSWARVYYKSGMYDLPSSALSFIESSRPSSSTTAASARFVSQVPGNISIPRIRPREESNPTRPALTNEPADPRSYWVPPAPVHDLEVEAMTVEESPAAWSPHLHPDRGGDGTRRRLWRAPSLDEIAERPFSRRNLQVYAFCLGFVFPLAWIVASFLPLPPRPVARDEEAPRASTSVNPKVATMEEVRYLNARWWRTLNRYMSPFGLAIIIIVVVLAVLGTRQSGL